MFTVTIPKEMHGVLDHGDIIPDPLDPKITYKVYPIAGTDNVNVAVNTNPAGASQDTLKERFDRYVGHKISLKEEKARFAEKQLAEDKKLDELTANNAAKDSEKAAAEKEKNLAALHTNDLANKTIKTENIPEPNPPANNPNPHPANFVSNLGAAKPATPVNNPTPVKQVVPGTSTQVSPVDPASLKTEEKH